MWCHWRRNGDAWGALVHSRSYHYAINVTMFCPTHACTTPCAPPSSLDPAPVLPAPPGSSSHPAPCCVLRRARAPAMFCDLRHDRKETAVQFAYSCIQRDQMARGVSITLEFVVYILTVYLLSAGQRALASPCPSRSAAAGSIAHATLHTLGPPAGRQC